MVTNYYWHILQKGPNKPYYAMNKNEELTIEEKSELKKLIELYSSETLNYN